MTVAVEHDLPRRTRRYVSGELPEEELAHQKRLARQPPRIRIVRKQIDELVAEHGEAAWLEHDDWRARLEVRAERLQDFAQLMLCTIEKAVIVERPPAAERTIRKRDVAPGRFEHVSRRDGDLRMKVVVEGIRPEDHLPTARLPTVRSAAKPFDERAVGETRDIARLRDAAEGLDRPGQAGCLRHQVRQCRRE